MAIGGAYYYYQVRGNQLPQILQRFNRYQNVSTRLTIDEDEPPLDLNYDNMRGSGENGGGLLR